MLLVDGGFRSAGSGIVVQGLQLGYKKAHKKGCMIS